MPDPVTGGVEVGDCFMVGWSWAQVYAPGLLPDDLSIVGPVLIAVPGWVISVKLGATSVKIDGVKSRGDTVPPPVGWMVVDPRTVISVPLTPAVREAFAAVQRAMPPRQLRPS